MRDGSVDSGRPPWGDGEGGLGGGRGLRLLAGFALTLLALYLASRYSYNLFHSLAELFSIVVAFAVLAIAWHTRRFAQQGFLLFLGIALGLVAVIDTVHLLAYKGMGVFVHEGTDLPTQLWIAARYLFTLALLLAPLLVTAPRRSAMVASALLTVVWAGLLLTVFVWPVFPSAFVEGQGLTTFKKVSEYVICALLLVSMGLFVRRRRHLERSILALLLGAIGVSVVSELSFTLYSDPYGLLNLVGHYFKIVAFFLIYLAIVDRTLDAPYALIFRTLRLRDEERDRLLARLDGISQVSEAAMQTLDTDELIDSVLSRLLPLVGAQSGVILLSEDDRLSAVAGVGFGPEHLSAARVNVGEGIAGRVASTGRPIFVEDVRDDPRVVSKLILKSGVTSLLAVPLRRGGELIGVMHVYWNERKTLDPADIHFVELLAERVAVALANADEYCHQRDLAEVLQRQMLSMPKSIPGVQFAHAYRSASKGAHVGGDFYDIFAGRDSRVWMLIGDVSGHGVPAATNALLIREITRAYVLEGGDPADILRRVNAAVGHRLTRPEFATMFLGVLDIQTGALDYSSAGHPPAVVSQPGAAVTELLSRALPIGVLTESSYVGSRTKLEPGQVLVLYTDGLVEARRNGEFFGEDRLKEIVAHRPAAVLPQELLKSVEEFTGGQLIDDLAVLCVAR